MLTFRAAAAHCYRIFDVADEIDLEKVRQLVKHEARRLTLKREGGQYIQLSNPPLAFEIGERSLTLKSGPITVKVGARVFDHGAISVVVVVPIAPGSTVEQLVPLADELYDTNALDVLAREEVKALNQVLLPAMQGPHDWRKNETYTVIVAREFEGAPSIATILEEPALAQLLLGEAQATLSSSEKREVLAHHHSYTENDLAIIEWNAAFLYEPSGSEDLMDLMEIANAQLLELRYYDEVLDAELARVYDVIGQKKGGSIFYSPYRRLLRELMLTLIELSEFIERAENALKIVGDVYLARVYETAVEQLRIRQWVEQVSRKHRLLQQTYSLLKGEVDHDRALTLEVLVVLLILFEILMALFRVSH